MGPSALPEGSKFKGDQDSRKPKELQRKFQKCPLGTVPFRRTRKEDLIRAEIALNLMRRTSLNPSVTASNVHVSSCYHQKNRSHSIGANLLVHLHRLMEFCMCIYKQYAVVSAKDPSQNFYGAKTSISVYNLSEIAAPQISQAMLWIGTAVEGPYNSLEYGWTVRSFP